MRTGPFPEPSERLWKSPPGPDACGVGRLVGLASSAIAAPTKHTRRTRAPTRPSRRTRIRSLGHTLEHRPHLTFDVHLLRFHLDRHAVAGERQAFTRDLHRAGRHDGIVGALVEGLV